MDPPEDPLARAERHVREAEGHVARLVAIVEELKNHNHPEPAARAEKVLATLRRSLELSREHLRMERGERGLEP